MGSAQGHPHPPYLTYSQQFRALHYTVCGEGGMCEGE